MNKFFVKPSKSSDSDDSGADEGVRACVHLLRSVHYCWWGGGNGMVRGGGVPRALTLSSIPSFLNVSQVETNENDVKIKVTQEMFENFVLDEVIVVDVSTSLEGASQNVPPVGASSAVQASVILSDSSDSGAKESNNDALVIVVNDDNEEDGEVIFIDDDDDDDVSTSLDGAPQNAPPVGASSAVHVIEISSDSGDSEAVESKQDDLVSVHEYA